jgi:hypothetical protein
MLNEKKTRIIGEYFDGKLWIVTFAFVMIIKKHTKRTKTHP